MTAVVQIERLSRRVGDFGAVKEIELEVGPGEIFGLLGPNGAGKTTTIRRLMGILQATPGSARVLGLDCFARCAEVVRHVGYLPDEPTNGLDPYATRTFHELIREAAWVLKHCQLAIGNDSGPMHIADAVVTPHLTLFGPTCEIKNGPRNRGAALRHDVPCSPCQYDLELLDSYPEAVCMRGLSAASVMERVVATASPSP